MGSKTEHDSRRTASPVPEPLTQATTINVKTSA